MKKIFILFIFSCLITPFASTAESTIAKPTNLSITRSGETAVLSWKNPNSAIYANTVLFRSGIPIEEFFSYEAVAGLCDLIYEGNAETYTDTGLAVNLPYYYIFFARDKSGGNSNAVVIEKKITVNEKKPVTETVITTNEQSSSGKSAGNSNTLAGASSNIVNQISLNEADIVYNYNGEQELPQDSNAKRLSLFIIVKSPHDLNEKDKNAISYFIHAGTPTTIFLGTGERAGILNSYLSVFNKLPRNTLEWQDIIKIANGRWPDERNLERESQATGTFFSAIYKRQPDMSNPNDNAAVTIIAYGLRPAARNIESEKNAIEIYRSIFNKSPSEAADWDLVRAIAYSGAAR